MKRALLIVAFGLAMLAATACGPDQRSCCERLIVVPANTTYRAWLGNPDGGPATEVTLVLPRDGGAKLTFREGTRVIDVRADALRN